jgi:RAQPRD family integrative conjugative element protein
MIKNKMKTTILKTLLVMGLSASLMSTVYADTENEHALLAEVIQQINALTPLINQAQAQADPNARVVFNYAQLRSDLQLIKDGINQPLTSTALEPRQIAPLSGDYVSLRTTGGAR